jgi:predicted dehydrogenase
VIGCGDIARYVGLFARLDLGLQITACCDRRPEAAVAFARRFRVRRVYEDFCELIGDEQVDGIYIAVPHHLHYEMLAAAIAARKPALCEKPIARTLAEGRAVAGLAQATGVKVGINYQYRYDSGAYALAQAARGGDLGRLLYARCHLPWRRTPDYFAQGPWRASLASAGGGTLLTQGSHLLDLALWAMGAEPVAAVGLTARQCFDVEVEDLAQGIVELAGGAQVEITSTMAAAQEGPVQVEVHGEKGSGIYTDRPWPHVRWTGVRPPARRTPASGLHALQRSLRAFRDWVLEDRPFLIPAGEALPALAAVEAIYRSAASGKKEPVQ